MAIIFILVLYSVNVKESTLSDYVRCSVGMCESVLVLSDKKFVLFQICIICIYLHSKAVLILCF